MSETMEIIDSHAHLFLPEFEGDYPGVLQRARESGVRRIVNVGLGPRTNALVLDAFRETPGLHPTVGWHPNSVEGLTEADLPPLASLLDLPGVVAFGEIGLDYYRGKDFVETQRKALPMLLEVAAGGRKPVIIHCREAWDDFFDLMGPHWASLKAVLLHCYSGDGRVTKKALDHGCHFSYAGAITYKNAEALRDTIPMIPADRLLIETDAPFLAPVPKRGKRNEPALLALTAESLARARGLEPDEAAALTSENAVRLFGLTGPGL